MQRDVNAGEMEVVNGYFVHFFVPEGLDSGEKHVVFILDRSGSMSGQKFMQVKVWQSSIEVKLFKHACITILDMHIFLAIFIFCRLRCKEF